MVDPYEFVSSSSTMKSKQKRRKSIVKTSKRRKSNETSRFVSTRQANSTKNSIRTRSNTRDKDNLMNISDKENNPNNNGFTQLIQTKMLEMKKQQGNRKNKKTNQVTEDNHSPLITGKRQRLDNEDNSEDNPVSTEIEIQGNNLLPSTTDEHANAGSITTTTCHPRCDSKDHHLVPAHKRRRACLCSKRQLDELEFAPDSVPSQSQQRQYEQEQEQPQQQHNEEEEQQPIQEESHLEPVLPSVHHSPPPLLLPTSPVMQPSTYTFVNPPIPSVSIIQHEENYEKEEEEVERDNQLNVPSIIAAPLSPAMPLNSTYIARRSIPNITQIPPTILGLSTLLPSNQTTRSNDDVSSIVPISNVEQTKSDQSSLLAPIESTSNKHDQHTSMTPPTAVQTNQCSISTQTSDDHYPTHHHHHHPCHDVSLCPCVQIYTRSEQLFMTSMAIFFRNSIAITPQESSLTTINSNHNNNPLKKNNKRQQINDQNKSSQLTSINNEIEISIPIQIERNDNVGINETYVINDNNIVVSLIEPERQASSSILVDTSTIIHEHHDDNSKKSDGSSIQVNINSKQISNEENFNSTSSNDDQQKFQSLVLAMTALKDEQKIVFNRFLEYFSVRSSTSIDDTTTHLITDEENENSLICPLTGKVLQAVARHLTIVSYRWLKACLTEQRYVNEIPTYEIIGDTIYNQHNGMSRSRLNHSNNSRLLANYAFHLKCHSCQPFNDNRPLIELIHLSGGLILKTLNQHIDNIGRQIMILCSKNYLKNKPTLEQACQKLNILCVEPEWLIASIVKFDIQPYEPWLCTLFS